MQRTPGRTIEHDDGLALVRDRECGNLAQVDGLAFDNRAEDGERVLPDFLGIMFHPAGLRIVLSVIARLSIERMARRIEEQRLRGRRALIEGEDERHWRASNPRAVAASPSIEMP